MKLIFKNADVLDVVSGEYARKTDVLVEAGRIRAAGRDLPSEDAAVVDCDGKYILPSFIDAHAHLTSEEMAYQYLASGVTAVRHLSGGERMLRYAREVTRGETAGPYLYSSSPIIDGDGAEEKFPSHVYVSTPEEAGKAVRSAHEAGYLWIKNYPSLTYDEFERLMKTANELGMKVSGHMSYSIPARTLADWGYACCEHSSSLPHDDEAIDYMADMGMWFCPTEVVCETLPDYVWNGKQFTDLPHFRYITKKTLAFWEESNKRIIEGYKKRGLRPDINVIIARGRRFMDRSSRYMAGADAMYPGIAAGFSLHDEMHKLVSLYGRTPLEAIRAATVNPATYMGLSAFKGNVKPGLDSDMVILERDPLSDIGNTSSIFAVVQGERYYDRAALDGMLSSLEDPDREWEEYAPLF